MYKKGGRKQLKETLLTFLEKWGKREAKNTAQRTHEAFPQERGGRKENRICRYSVPQKKGKRRRGLFLTPVLLFLLLLLLLLLLHLRSQSRRRRRRRSVTAVPSKSRVYNEHCVSFFAKTWAWVTLAIERLTHNCKVVGLYTGSSSYGLNEARTTSGWRGQDPREPREKLFF